MPALIKAREISCLSNLSGLRGVKRHFTQVYKS
jgi:hypothetical protein